MNTITPPEIDEAVRIFCSEVAPGNEPIHVKVIPRRGAKQDECFPNVREAVRAQGGRIVYGWTIWVWPRVYFEAEHHAVWETPGGTLVDVTPKAAGEKRILFQPDPGRTYDFAAFRRIDTCENRLPMTTTCVHLFHLQPSVTRLLKKTPLGTGSPSLRNSCN
jgi:hypothetical protein